MIVVTDKKAIDALRFYLKWLDKFEQKQKAKKK